VTEERAIFALLCDKYAGRETDDGDDTHH